MAGLSSQGRKEGLSYEMLIILVFVFVLSAAPVFAVISENLQTSLFISEWLRWKTIIRDMIYMI